MSNETKWTPGPWVAVDHDRYPGMITVKGPISPITIVTSATDIDYAGYCRRVCEAHLIAAAPELYDSLKCMVDRYAPSYHDCTDDGLPECDICAARAALSKARGESA